MFSMSEHELRAWGYWSNKFTYDPREKYALITSYQAVQGDWALNHPLLLHGFGLLAQGWQVKVCMVRDDGTFDIISVTNFAKLLAETPNLGRDDDHGAYHWVNEAREHVPVKDPAA